MCRIEELRLAVGLIETLIKSVSVFIRIYSYIYGEILTQQIIPVYDLFKRDQGEFRGLVPH